ncbi:MAG: hypothetical protein HY782_04355 [Chloroflexi bacterium]|nr:hypothetical protein [Chloroflexota bacterium]
MALLSRSELDTLAQTEGKWCISIFMPTHRAGQDTQQDPIRLRSLFKQAETRLLEEGLRGPQANDLLKPAQELLDRHDFWQSQSDGLAVFVSPQLNRFYRLPFPFAESVMVNTRFYLKPLIPLLSGDGRFFVLALSQNQVRLLEGTRYSVDEIYLDGLPNLPKNLADALKYDQFDRAAQSHTFSGEGGAKFGRTAIFHGQGSNQEDPKTNVRIFFQQVNEGLRAILAHQHAPLILAGVEFLHPLYREVNIYPHLVEKGIFGNPEILKADELHARALAILQPLFEEPQKHAVETYRQLAGEKSDRASNDLKQIVPAAIYGRVGTLFVAKDAQLWGKFDPASDLLHVHTQRERGDEDLLDLAATQTLRNHGDVYAFEASQMPDRSPADAVFRY